jgi:3-phosphoshikimate 1-carboxyvinyltransferase
VRPLRGPLRGEVRPPGDKSISHRALLLGAIAEGTTTVTGVLDSADVRSTASCLAALGRPARGDWTGTVSIEGGALSAPPAPLDCGNSGTTLRLLAGLLAGWPLEATLVGDASLSRRPMERVAGPLRAMGARVELAPGGTAPLRLRGGPLRGQTHATPIASAQVKSALLLAGLRAEGTTRLREPARSRDHTERLLRAMGARLEQSSDGELALAGGQRLRARAIDVPADPSSAAFLLVAGLLVPGSDVRCTGVGLNPTRTGVLDALRAFGAEVEATVTSAADAVEPSGTVRAVAPRGLRGVDLGGELVLRAIDEVPILGVLAAFAAGRTTIRDAAELRVKESDRLAVLARGLRRLGVSVEERPDGVVVEGDPERTLLGGVELATESDHRLAMAFGVAALRAAAPPAIEDPACVEVSYRPFWSDLARLAGG